MAEHDSGFDVAGGAVLACTAGLVVGLFAPPRTRRDRGRSRKSSAVVGELMKKYEEKHLGVEMKE